MADGWTVRPVGVVRSGLTDPGDAPRQPDEGAPPARLVFDDAVGVKVDVDTGEGKKGFRALGKCEDKLDVGRDKAAGTADRLAAARVIEQILYNMLADALDQLCLLADTNILAFYYVIQPVKGVVIVGFLIVTADEKHPTTCLQLRFVPQLLLGEIHHHPVQPRLFRPLRQHLIKLIRLLFPPDRIPDYILKCFELHHHRASAAGLLNQPLNLSHQSPHSTPPAPQFPPKRFTPFC